MSGNNQRIARFTRHSVFANGPVRSHAGDAGYDLSVSEDCHIIGNGSYWCPTSIKIQPPPGYWFRLVGRSSTYRHLGLQVAEAIIDGGYRGKLEIMVLNLTSDVVHLKSGDRIAQLIPHQVIDLDWEETSFLEESARGESGYGSTGR